ncbi:MAG: septal ring lytic transglycosylase RlpA family protein [Cyanobacteria bacterium J06632_3]
MLLLSKGSLKQRFAAGLTAAVCLSVANATLAGAKSASHLDDNTKSVATLAKETSATASLSDSSVSEASASESTETPTVLASGGAELSQPVIAPLPANGDAENSDDVLVYPHTIDGRQAATLYVKDIPVLTFIGTEVDSLSNSSDAVSFAAASLPTSDPEAALDAESAPAGDILDDKLENDPVLRATSLGRQLDPAQVDAAELSVRWHEETDGYIVTLADEDFITLDSRTILADTTEDPAEDALQVTNRLRRLIGEADPITEIEGLPEPEPVVAAAPTPAITYTNVGAASWYGPGFHGRLTASGEVYNQYDITAAHRTLPFGTRVLVTNLYTGRQVTVRINDRGPYAGNRIIDLSKGAADQIGLTSSGVGTVQLDILY